MKHRPQTDDTLPSDFQSHRRLDLMSLRRIIRIGGGDVDALIDVALSEPVTLETVWGVVQAYLYRWTPIYPAGDWDELEAARMRDRILAKYSRFSGRHPDMQFAQGAGWQE